MSKKNKGTAADDSQKDKDVEDVEDTDTEDTDEEEAEDEDESEDESAEDDEDSEDEDESDSDDEDESDDEDSEDEDDSDDEDESESSSTEDELDLDAELERERQAAEPDKDKAKKEFKKRDKKRKSGEGVITEARLQEILAADRKERQRDDALRIAKGMAGSDKEAELIVAKWANRTFPKNLTLSEQITEAYAITHAKRLIGERNEAMRALKGKRGVTKKGAASAHREGDRNPNEPKLPPAEAASLRASGFTWNVKSRRYEKKLPNGRLLIRDNKTKQVRLAPRQ